MKYQYKLCDKCREMIAKFNRLEAKRRRKLGIVGGRPRKKIDAKLFARIVEQLEHGTYTIEQAAKKLGVSGITLRRRLREYTSERRAS